jgi:hypothetical protein
MAFFEATVDGFTSRFEWFVVALTMVKNRSYDDRRKFNTRNFRELVQKPKQLEVWNLIFQ